MNKESEEMKIGEVLCALGQHGWLYRVFPGTHSRKPVVKRYWKLQDKAPTAVTWRICKYCKKSQYWDQNRNVYIQTLHVITEKMLEELEIYERKRKRDS